MFGIGGVGASVGCPVGAFGEGHAGGTVTAGCHHGDFAVRKIHGHTRRGGVGLGVHDDLMIGRNRCRARVNRRRRNRNVAATHVAHLITRQRCLHADVGAPPVGGVARWRAPCIATPITQGRTRT